MLGFMRWERLSDIEWRAGQSMGVGAREYQVRQQHQGWSLWVVVAADWGVLGGAARLAWLYRCKRAVVWWGSWVQGAGTVQRAQRMVRRLLLADAARVWRRRAGE